MSGLQWAVALSVISAISYALAAVVQERLAAGGHRSVPRWALSLVLTGVGAGLHVVALSYGTVGVVQALGALTLLFAMPIAAVRTRVRVTAEAWRDAGMTVAGLAGVLALASSSDVTATLSSAESQALSLLTVAGVAALAYPARLASSPRVRSLLLAAAAGVAFGIGSVLTKSELAAMSAGGLGATSVPALAAIALLAIAGLLLSQFSYRGAGLAAPLAMVSVANPVVAASVGILLLGDGVRFGATGALLAVVAAVVAARGVVGLAARTASDTGPGAPEPVASAPKRELVAAVR